MTSDEVLDAIGEGMRLFIPYDGSQCLLIDGIAYWHGNNRRLRPAVAVDGALAKWLVQSGLLAKLEENSTDDRIGWRECRLEEYGEKGDLYACVQ
jgi:hypothetical protein